MIRRIFTFISRERLYFLLIVFMLLVNTLIVNSSSENALGGGVSSSADRATKAGIDSAKGVKELFFRTEAIGRALRENKPLASLFAIASLLIVSVLLLGILVDILFISARMRRADILIFSQRPLGVRWGVWDVGKVIILFLFFGYMLVMIESFLAKWWPIFKHDNFRMIFNSSILDAIAVISILYFVRVEHKEKLAALGLSFNNFSKNVIRGIVGYIAVIPALAILLLVIAAVIQFTQYVPERQPVVELFLKEKNAPFLLYSSLFAALAGPFVEELFFRGFMYSAVKKTIGIFWATLLTAAIFACLHANVVGFLPIMVLGILLAYLYERTGTIVSSVTVHAAHNLSMVFFVFLAKKVHIG